MNYSRVQSAAIAGTELLPVVVECAQTRRLPYLQIIGASPGASLEMRERVASAIDSAGFRLPSRRITVQFHPGLHGLPIEALDLAVALAILGGAGHFPAKNLEGLLASGALGLDGGLRPVCGESGLRKLLASGARAGALLPREEAGALSSLPQSRGGSFASLAEVMRFLRGEVVALPPPPLHEEKPPPPAQAWRKLRGQAVARRVLEIAAAGGHHLLLAGPRSAGADLLAHALSSLLPGLSSAQAAEVRAVYALAGIDPPPSRPFHFFRSGQGLPPLLLDRRLAKVEEALLGHHGVVFVERINEREEELFPEILQPMAAGKFAARVGRRRIEVGAELILVGSSGFCGCGASGDPFRLCACRPSEARRHLQRLEGLLQYPFDLFQRIHPASGEEEGQDSEAVAGRVAAARSRMEGRQGQWNGRLLEEEALVAKTWNSGALSLWRTLARRPGAIRRRSEALARVALTISDLRAGTGVEEADLLEASHYFPEGFEPAFGSRSPRPVVSETNSSAIP